MLAADVAENSRAAVQSDSHGYCDLSGRDAIFVPATKSVDHRDRASQRSCGVILTGLRYSESRTDGGRVVYSGGGINPDVPIKPETIELERARAQQKLTNPIFAFALDLVVGRVKGFENYKIEKPITFGYDITKNDFPVTQALFDSFKTFAVSKYKVTPAQLDREREFIERTLRTELVTAAYGSQTSGQVFNEYDDQLLKAIELLPQAKQLALDSSKNTANKPNPGIR